MDRIPIRLNLDWEIITIRRKYQYTAAPNPIGIKTCSHNQSVYNSQSLLILHAYTVLYSIIIILTLSVKCFSKTVIPTIIEI